MSSRIPCPASVVPTPSMACVSSRVRAVKRLNNRSNFVSSPEKRAKFSTSNTSTRLNDQSVERRMPCPKSRPPKVATGMIRRSVSMNTLAPNQRDLMDRSVSRGSMQNLTLRQSNVSASRISKIKDKSTVSARAPLKNMNHIPDVEPPSVSKYIPKGKSKRPGWDIKGRLEDMETKLKESCQKVSHYDSRIASLESEKQAMSQNLEQTKSYSRNAQEEINLLNSQLRQEQIEKCNLKTCKENLERKSETLQAELSSELQNNIALKSSVDQLVSFKVSIEAEFSSTKLLLETEVKRRKELEELSRNQEESMKEMSLKVMTGEMSRRRLHNMVQELKGNIRVFCRVRPLIKQEVEGNGGSETIHHINFFDEKSLELIKNANLDGSSMSGLKSRSANYEFSFDRIFCPTSSQAQVFEEISQMVQSALDGYNVCVFAYGQTGSGKTFTMEGVFNDQLLEGMIPRTAKLIFTSLEELETKGWSYSLEASYLEIYNETIRDLLADPREVKQTVYDIKLVDGKKPDIFVTNLKVVPVESVSCIHELLYMAQKHRSVAATNMNERSSRSHSVFQLKLNGSNKNTNETCHGILNLVDLAGSERLKESKSEGDRLSEAQYINKSLANLGNVIMALAQKQNHIPYRNSKLTYLLQNSLGGNSKTLMFVNVSPLAGCFNETLNSLRFATNVNQCHIGTAKQVKRL